MQKKSEMIQKFIVLFILVLQVSCNVNFDIEKRRYRKGYHVSLSTNAKKETPVLASDSTEKTFSNKSQKTDYLTLPPQDVFAENTSKEADRISLNNSTAEREMRFYLPKKSHYKSTIKREQNIKIDQIEIEEDEKDKLSAIFLILGLVGLLSFLVLLALPTPSLIAFLGSTFILFWFLGIITSFVFLTKKRKAIEKSTEMKLDAFSKWGSILEILSLIGFIVMLVGGLVVLFGGASNLFVISAFLMGIFSILSVFLSTIGLIRSILNVNQSKKNRWKALFIAVISPIALVLSISLFLSVISAFNTISPFAAAIIQILGHLK